MKIALTFDDGPSEWTAPILDLLAEHDARATFFVVGEHIIGNVEIVDRIHAEGHELGNHTTTHPDLSTLLPERVRAELAETALMITAITGQSPQVWRAPYLRLPVDELPPFPHIGCTIIPGDWNEPSAEVLADGIVALAQDGDIVLLHDGRPPGQPPHDQGGSLDTREHTVEAVRLLLPRLVERGFGFVTASELVAQVSV